ncbi:MAG: DUF916 domain-containing protein [Minisyncoccia bacterium]
MKDFFLKTLVLGLFIVTPVLGLGTASAQTEGIQIRPAIIEDKVDPGQIYRFTIKVTNIADNERTFNLLARDITGLDDRGVPIFSEEGVATTYELSSWVKLPQDSILLKAGQSADIPFSILVPTDATPGAHFGGVFFEVRPDQLQTTGAAVGSRVGTIINLRIAGDVTEEMRLREFSTEEFIYDAPPVTFSARVDNLGNVLLRPHGLVEITDMFGKKVGNIEVNKSAAAVFPGGDREYKVVWEQDGLVFGRYQALLSFVYGEDGRKTIVRATSFWVLPLKPTLITLGLIFGLILALYLTVKLYINRKLRSMGVSGKDTQLYAKRYHKPISRVTFVVLGLLIFVLILLALLFFMFA